MAICRRCVLPAIPGLIDLGDDGICADCRDYRSFDMQDEKTLLRLLGLSRQRSGGYDAMVTVSGGRDSAFTLLKLVRDYRLRVLAVNYRNPFADEQAEENIARMARIVKVDLIRFRLPGNLHRRILRNNLQAWLNRPSAAMVPVICVGCKIIWPRIMAIARRHRISCIVSGGNPYEYTAFKKALLGVSPGAGLTQTYLRNVFRLAREALGNPPYLKPAYLLHTLKGYLFANPYALGSRLLGRRLQKIDLFHFIPWDEEEVLSRIESEIGWRAPSGLFSTWRFDCRLSHLKDLMYLTTLGITEKDDFYSQLIRDGKISRREALDRLQREHRIDRAAIESIFRQLDLKLPEKLDSTFEQVGNGSGHAAGESSKVQRENGRGEKIGGSNREQGGPEDG